MWMRMTGDTVANADVHADDEINDKVSGWG
jgi:hypothetical protein